MNYLFQLDFCYGTKGLNERELMPLAFLPLCSALVRSDVFMYYRFIGCPHVVLGQFVCIAQQDYWRILNHVERNTHKVEEEGEIVMVHEHRELDRSGTRKGHIVIKVGVLLTITLVTDGVKLSS